MINVLSALDDRLRPGLLTGHARNGRVYAKFLGFGLLLVLLMVASLQGADSAEIKNVADTLNQDGSVASMNQNLSNVFAIVLILAIPLGILVYLHNSLVNREEAVISAWSDVESNYQRRLDLVPRLIEAVEHYLRHESETITQVVQQRNSALQSTADELRHRQGDSAEALSALSNQPPTDGTQLLELSARDLKLRAALQGLAAVVEAYPELRSADQFLALQAQLEGTENRINVARIRFNEQVKHYNASLRRLPGSLVAGIGNFQRKAYFKADVGAASADPLDL